MIINPPIFANMSDFSNISTYFTLIYGDFEKNEP